MCSTEEAFLTLDLVLKPIETRKVHSVEFRSTAGVCGGMWVGSWSEGQGVCPVYMYDSSGINPFMYELLKA